MKHDQNMQTQIENNIATVILAAGKGTRLNCTDKPKVMLEIGNKPVVSYIVETLSGIGFDKDQMVLVVGFEKGKVMDYFGDTVTYAEQTEQLGTAHATCVGMEKLTGDVEHVLVMGGDDSAFYTEETLMHFVDSHTKSGAVLSLLTAEVENPEGLGRIIRNDEGLFVQVLEKEQLSVEQKDIREISTGTFCFNKKWFETIFQNKKQNNDIGEKDLPKTVEMAVEAKEKIQAIKLENSNEWFGINTLDELQKANELKNLSIL